MATESSRLAGADLVRGVRAALARSGDPERAMQQQRYMKSAMPYHGVTLPRVRALTRPLLRRFAPASRQEWEDAVLGLWDEATHREQRYAAIAVARHRAAAPWQDPEALSLYRHLVVTGAWWDTVDEIAAHLVGGVLAGHRDATTPVIKAWSGDEDLWLRRTSVICQLHHGTRTDTDLLREVIAANLGDPSFWLRKAIGWALRQYARTDPQWVLTQVTGWGEHLSSLSRREALKHLAPGPPPVPQQPPRRPDHQ